MIFLNSANSAAALVFDLCAHTDNEVKLREVRVRNIFYNLRKKTQYFMNTLYVGSTDQIYLVCGRIPTLQYTIRRERSLRASNTAYSILSSEVEFECPWDQDSRRPRKCSTEQAERLNSSYSFTVENILRDHSRVPGTASPRGNLLTPKFHL